MITELRNPTETCVVCELVVERTPLGCLSSVIDAAEVPVPVYCSSVVLRRRCRRGLVLALENAIGDE
jgi:hypothetical protein